MGGAGEAHQAAQGQGQAAGPCLQHPLLQHPLLSRGGFALHSQLPPVAPYGAARGQEYSTSGDFNLVCNQRMSMEEGHDVGDPKDV